jgi:hypothetical protein
MYTTKITLGNGAYGYLSLKQRGNLPDEQVMGFQFWTEILEISSDELEKEQLTRKEENHNPSNLNVE